MIARASARLSPASSRWASESSAIEPRRLRLASVDSVLTPPRVTGLPPHIRGEPSPRHGGPLVLLRWMRAHRMLTFNYARLLVRLGG